MRKIFTLLAATFVAACFAPSVLGASLIVEDDVMPKGQDLKHENVQYHDLQQLKYYSSTAECERPVNVFVPHDYDPNKKYPVLYLLHGLGGNEFEWFGGAPNEIISNLVAEGSVQEMIVVVPNIRVRHKSVTQAPPFMSIEHFKEFDAFLDDFQTSLKPEIEKRFSIAPERANHAIAGLSMGGREALHLGIKLCEQFAYIGAFEPAPGLLPYADEESLFTPDTLTLPDEYKGNTYIMTTKGDRDGVVRDWPKVYAETLQKNGVDPHFVELHGGHDFKVWKESLYRFVKIVFSQNKADSEQSQDDAVSELVGNVIFQLNSNNIQNGLIKQRFGKFEPLENNKLSCEIEERCDNPWDAGFRFVLDRPVAKGEILLLQFKAKTIAAKTESGLAKVRPFFEHNQPPHTKSLFRVVEIGRETREYSFPISCVNDQEAGKSAFGLFMGDIAQTIEISDVKLTSFGQDRKKLAQLPDSVPSYKGAEPNAPWRKKAEERIEKIRKGNLNISVVDQTGGAVPTAQLSIRQKKSAFRWGTCVVAGRINEQSKNAEQYRDFIKKYCDVVVFENDLKWFGWANPKGRENVMKALDWFDAQGIAVRGHNLVWPSWRNSDNRWKELANAPDKLRQTVRDHVLEEAAGMKGRVCEWDVVNEPYDNRDIWQILGKEEIAEWFKIARQGEPDATLFLNDYGILSSQGLDKKKQDFYYRTLKEILDAGAPLGGIGMQGHFGSEATPPEKVIEIIERFAELGLPIAITEHDIDSTNDKYQAEFTRDFMTAVFSCEAVQEFLIWGFWERSHWRPNAAYMTADWQLTPAGKVWTELVGKEWRSNIDEKTDFYGEFSTRVFCGEYEITAKNGAQSNTVIVSVPKEGANVEIQFK